jgi:hypothetical protein
MSWRASDASTRAMCGEHLLKTLARRALMRKGRGEHERACGALMLAARRGSERDV